MQNNDNNDGEELVVIFDAPDQPTAEMVCTTLQAAGIRAAVQNQYAAPGAGWLSYLGSTFGRGVLVPASEADAARALLGEQELTEEEIDAAVADEGKPRGQ